MEDKLITLKNYENMVEALFDQDLLRQNDIESSLSNEDTVDLLPMFSDTNNGLGIVVFEKDFEKALKVLEEYKNSVPAEE
jgi:hypothetical protein